MYIRDNVLHAKVLNHPGIYVNSRNRRGSTPVSSVLIFHNKKLSKLQSCSISTYNIEINLNQEIIRRFAWLHPRTMELANVLSE